MVNVKVEDGYDYHMFGSSGNNDDEAELAVYSLQPLDLADLDENGDFILPLSCRSDSSKNNNNSNNMATSPRRTTPVRKCRSRHFATVSPATTVSTSYSDISIQDSFDDYQDKNCDNDNDFWTPKQLQSPRPKTKTNNRKASTRRTYKKTQPRRKSRSTAASIASASAADIDEELGYSVQVGKDVLCGRGQKIKVLNEHYRKIIRENYPPYVATQCDITKREIAKRVWSHIVEENGGRFLDINGAELNKPMAVLKIMKALKDAKKQHGKPLSHSTQKIRATVQTIRAATPVLKLSSSRHIHLRKNLVTPPIQPKPIKKISDPLSLVEPLSVEDPEFPIEDDSFLETLNWLACME